jgi:hypothetical protein
MGLTRSQHVALEIILFACALLAMAMAMAFLDLLDLPVDDLRYVPLEDGLGLFAPALASRRDPRVTDD